MPTEVAREGDTLRFDGPLDRAVVASLWPRTLGLAGGASRLDLRAVARIDSAGLAMLSELATRSPHALVVEGAPPGLVDLRAAYRLDHGLRPVA